jgi:protein-L-isoaspartate(D-aspartate) O-methyltransferase
LEDNYRHKGLRRQLIESLQRKGIHSEEVLSAMMEVPRHLFMDQAFADHAYKDKALPIDKDQSISQPYTVARMTELLEVERYHKVLEIGTGSGYQAAILAELGARVYTVERHRLLYEKARDLLKRLGYEKVRCFYRDGFKGLASYGPYDRIIVTAAAPSLPPALLTQLAVGGKLVLPLGIEHQEMVRITKQDEERYHRESFGEYRFVPFLEGLDDT